MLNGRLQIIQMRTAEAAKQNERTLFVPKAWALGSQALAQGRTMIVAGSKPPEAFTIITFLHDKDETQPPSKTQNPAAVIFHVHHRWSPGHQTQLFADDPSGFLQLRLLAAELQLFPQEQEHPLPILPPPG